MYSNISSDRQECEHLIQQIKSHDQNMIDMRLSEIDWSFSNRIKGDKLESIHPYPAKFIPDIPRSFLEALPLPAGTAVFDPFCGSGTTLVESQRLGVPSFGVDLNPIACLISRVKTSTAPADATIKVVSIIHEAKKIDNAERFSIPNVDHWFKEEIQDAIAKLTQVISKYASTDVYDVLRLALSSIIVRVSNQESDTRYAAIEKNVTSNNVFEYFATACLKILNALEGRQWNEASVKVIESDILKINSTEIDMPIGMIITSPPYPNAYEYWLYHKYRMWWLGFDPLAVKTDEIGARAHFFKRNHHTEENFWTQMRGTFDLIDAVLVQRGWACFVIGRSKIHGKIIDNAEIIKRIAEEKNMTFISRIERIISPFKKSFNLSHANIKTESVLVFKKG